MPNMNHENQSNYRKKSALKINRNQFLKPIADDQSLLIFFNRY